MPRPYRLNILGTASRSAGLFTVSARYFPAPKCPAVQEPVQSIKKSSVSKELRYSATLKSPSGLAHKLKAAKSYIQGLTSNIFNLIRPLQLIIIHYFRHSC